MKKYLSLILSILLLIIMLPPLCAAGSENEAKDSFTDISKLVQENWDDNYIGKMTFTIGDSIMSVDNTDKEIDPGRDTAPMLVNERTMLPIRTIVEEMGGSVEWNEDNQEIYIEKGGTELKLQIDNNIMEVNGDNVTLDSEPFTSNDRTFLPLRAISEALCCDVEWEDESESATVSPLFQTKRLIVKMSSEPDLAQYGATDIVKIVDNTYAVQFSKESDAKAVYDMLSSTESTEYVEPDQYIPSVSEAGGSLGTFGTSSSGAMSWGAERINSTAYAKYLNYYNMNREVTVAVVDSGVDYNHSFLKSRIVSKGRDFFNKDKDAMDDNYHGTHVAGTIVDNTPNLNVKILPVKVANSLGEGTTSLNGLGIRYAVECEADIINLSRNTKEAYTNKEDYKNDGFEKDSIDYAVNNGVTVVVIAGNKHNDALLYSPSYITTPGVIVVAACDSNDKATDFSNYGSSVDLAAPGDEILSTYANNGYSYMKGTSMAAPHISALAAMLKVYNYSYTPDRIEEILKSISTPCKPFISGKNYGGIPDMKKLIFYEISDPAPATLKPSAVPKPTAKPTARPTARPTEKPIVDVDEIIIMPSIVDLSVGETKIISANAYPSNATDRNIIYESSDDSVATVSSGGKITAKSPGNARIKVYTSGKTAIAYCNVTVHEDVIPVEKISFLQRNRSIAVGESCIMDVVISPPNATDQELVWSSDKKSVATVDSNGKVTGISEGTANITVKLKNGTLSEYGTVSVMNNSSDTFSVTLDNNTYSGGYDEDIPVEIIVQTPDEYKQGSHKYTLYIAYLNNGWQQCNAPYIDGGSAKIKYTINAKKLGIPKDKKTVTFTFSLFNSDNFTTGAAITEQQVKVKFE